LKQVRADKNREPQPVSGNINGTRRRTQRDGKQYKKTGDNTHCAIGIHFRLLDSSNKNKNQSFQLVHFYTPAKKLTRIPSCGSSPGLTPLPENRRATWPLGDCKPSNSRLNFIINMNYSFGVLAALLVFAFLQKI
jgi:hypothetical protein